MKKKEAREELLFFLILGTAPFWILPVLSIYTLWYLSNLIINSICGE